MQQYLIFEYAYLMGSRN